MDNIKDFSDIVDLWKSEFTRQLDDENFIEQCCNNVLNLERNSMNSIDFHKKTVNIIALEAISSFLTPKVLAYQQKDPGVTSENRLKNAVHDFKVRLTSELAQKIEQALSQDRTIN